MLHFGPETQGKHYLSKDIVYIKNDIRYQCTFNKYAQMMWDGWAPVGYYVMETRLLPILPELDSIKYKQTKTNDKKTYPNKTEWHQITVK